MNDLINIAITINRVSCVIVHISSMDMETNVKSGAAKRLESMRRKEVKVHGIPGACTVVKLFQVNL